MKANGKMVTLAAILRLYAGPAEFTKCEVIDGRLVLTLPKLLEFETGFQFFCF